MKTELRKRYINLRKTALSANERQTFSKEIAGKVLELVARKSADTVFCYSAYSGEAETDVLIDTLLRMGKTVALPLCDVKSKTMTARRIKSRQELSKGAYGIPEPSGDEIAPSDIDVIIVPLVAFDRRKTRLGYGGGYYDRYLAGTNAIKCGIAYSLQEAEMLPVGEYDIPLDMIITEKEVIE